MNDFDDLSDHRHNDSDDSIENWEFQNSRDRGYSLDKPYVDESYTAEIIAETKEASPRVTRY